MKKKILNNLKSWKWWITIDNFKERVVSGFAFLCSLTLFIITYEFLTRLFNHLNLAAFLPKWLTENKEIFKFKDPNTGNDVIYIFNRTDRLNMWIFSISLAFFIFTYFYFWFQKQLKEIKSVREENAN